jgi:glycosyltransferase involved in cell wall biosynthesis
MKILMLFPYAPLPPPFDLAGTKRNLPFLLELAKKNDVSVLALGTESQRQLFLRHYAHLISDVRFVDVRRRRWQNGLERLWLVATLRSPYRQLYRPEMQIALDEMLSKRSYDVVHCCVPMFGYYKFPSGIPITSDTHEVKFDLLRRTAAYDKRIVTKAFNHCCYLLGHAEEPNLWKRFDALIATTEVDRAKMIAEEPSLRPFVVQNGAGDEFFTPTGAAQEPGTVVFTGLFTHPPNIQGAEYFLDEVFPLICRRIPNAKVYLVGMSPPARLLRRASDRIVVTGFVEDVRPYIERAQAFVIPLLSGGGIRGKALEAMALGTPIVTTTVGVEGIHLRHRESALFADDPQLFADSVVELLEDPSLRAAIAKNASEIARQRYTWKAKGEELNHILHGVFAEWTASARPRMEHDSGSR